MNPDWLDVILVLVRWILALFVLYGIGACLLLGLKTIINFGAAGIGMILKTKTGKLAAAGAVLYVVYLAVSQGWRM